MRKRLIIAFGALLLVACSGEPTQNAPAPRPAPVSSGYLDNSGRDDALSGGARLVPVSTPKGTFRVWAKRLGNSPRIKALLLHGGPGATHERFEAFDSYRCNP